MATRKRIGALPPLPDIVEVKPLAFLPGYGQDISTHQFRPGAPKPVLKSILFSQEDDGCWEAENYSEEAPSPASSSTSSGPIYERPAGFKFHAHSIPVDKPKNKKVKGTKLPPLVKDAGKKKEAPSSSSLGAKSKIKKVSIPMKERPFPSSFQIEPNKTNPVIPPISSQRPFEADLGVNVNCLSIDQGEEEQNPRCVVYVSNKSDQLMKKLFDCIQKESKFTNQKSEKTDYLDTYNPGVSGRGDSYLLKNIREKVPSYFSASSKAQRTKEPRCVVPTLAVKNDYSQIFTEITELL